jgi:hypothetical protein
MPRLFHCRARVRQLELDRILPDPRGLALLVAPHDLHLVISQVRVTPRARRTSTVGAHHPAKRPAGLSKTIGDARVGHDLEIVLMGANPEVRHPAQRHFRSYAFSGHKDISRGM